MSREESSSKLSEEIARNVVKNVNKVLEVYLKQVFGPMVRDLKKIEEKLSNIEARLDYMITEKGAAAAPDASLIKELVHKAVESKVTSLEVAAAGAQEDQVGKEIAAASSKKEYIYSEMTKYADYFDAKNLPESQLYEKKELKDKLKEIQTFLNKEASTAGTPTSIIDIIQELIRLVKDLDYKLNSSLQARFYKEDFIEFIGDFASKEIRKIIKDLA
ncbi:MAG: hypothetical protein ACFFD4_18650 [Candidatus Odinarchaeota archaeon]